MRIKFLANGPLQDLGGPRKRRYRLTINPSYLMLKHYHTLHGKHQPTWLFQNFMASKTAQETVDLLLDFIKNGIGTRKKGGNDND